MWFPHLVLHQPVWRAQGRHEASDCHGRQHRAARLSRVTRKLGPFDLFYPMRKWSGRRGMNVRNAQECRWAPWRPFKAMRGVRAIEWVVSPWPEPPPEVQLLSTDFVVVNGLPCFLQRNLFYTWDGTSSSLWFMGEYCSECLYFLGTPREHFFSETKCSELITTNVTC